MPRGDPKHCLDNNPSLTRPAVAVIWKWTEGRVKASCAIFCGHTLHQEVTAVGHHLLSSILPQLLLTVYAHQGIKRCKGLSAGLSAAENPRSSLTQQSVRKRRPVLLQDPTGEEQDSCCCQLL